MALWETLVKGSFFLIQRVASYKIYKNSELTIFLQNLRLVWIFLLNIRILIMTFLIMFLLITSVVIFVYLGMINSIYPFSFWLKFSGFFSTQADT